MTDKGQSVQSGSPERLLSKKVLCIFYSFNKCKHGDACQFAHSLEELADPKSVMCPVFVQIRSCSDPLCPFAHNSTEHKPPHRIIKPMMCQFWLQNQCFAGNLCRHAHSAEELRSPKLTILESTNPSTPDESSDSDTEISRYLPRIPE